MVPDRSVPGPVKKSPRRPSRPGRVLAGCPGFSKEKRGPFLHFTEFPAFCPNPGDPGPALVRRSQTPPNRPGNPGPGKARIFENGRQLVTAPTVAKILCSALRVSQCGTDAPTSADRVLSQARAVTHASAGAAGTLGHYTLQYAALHAKGVRANVETVSGQSDGGRPRQTDPARLI